MASSPDATGVQLSSERQRHFDEQFVSVQEHNNLNLHDEINLYRGLNANLALSDGEQLFSARLINRVVFAADKVAKQLDKGMMTQLCKIVGRDAGKGRHNEVLVLSLIFYNVYYREQHDPLATSMCQTFLAMMRRFDGATLGDGDKKKIEDDLPDLMLLIGRALELYESSSGIAGAETKFRRFILCMVAMAAVPSQDLDAALYGDFVAKIVLKRDDFSQIFTSKHQIQPNFIADFRCKFNAFIKAARARQRAQVTAASGPSPISSPAGGASMNQVPAEMASRAQEPVQGSAAPSPNSTPPPPPPPLGSMLGTRLASSVDQSPAQEDIWSGRRLRQRYDGANAAANVHVAAPPSGAMVPTMNSGDLSI